MRLHAGDVHLTGIPVPAPAVGPRAVILHQAEDLARQAHQVPLNGPLGGRITLILQVIQQLTNGNLSRMPRNTPQHDPMAQ